MIYGYARVSTNHQDTELQLTALKSAGCEKIFEEHASGRKSNRPVLKRLIATMQPGDELVVWKLDRIGRNVLHALLMFQQLQEKGINFRSITDGVDLKTASGRYNFRNILSAAQYESDLNSERTLACRFKSTFTADSWNRYSLPSLTGGGNILHSRTHRRTVSRLLGRRWRAFHS